MPKNFFSLKNTNLRAFFCYWHFLIFCVKRLKHQIGEMNSSYIRHSFIHELLTSRERFFSKILNFSAWQTFWAKIFRGIWCIFGLTIRSHFGTVSSLSMFSIIQPLFIQKIEPLYPTPKILFGPQKIWDLTIVCPWSVVSFKYAIARKPVFDTLSFFSCPSSYKNEHDFGKGILGCPRSL